MASRTTKMPTSKGKLPREWKNSCLLAAAAQDVSGAVCNPSPAKTRWNWMMRDQRSFQMLSYLHRQRKRKTRCDNADDIVDPDSCSYCCDLDFCDGQPWSSTMLADVPHLCHHRNENVVAAPAGNCRSCLVGDDRKGAKEDPRRSSD